MNKHKSSDCVIFLTQSSGFHTEGGGTGELYTQWSHESDIAMFIKYVQLLISLIPERSQAKHTIFKLRRVSWRGTA